jgi:hypothetical protein
MERGSVSEQGFWPLKQEVESHVNNKTGPIHQVQHREGIKRYAKKS